MSVLLATPEGPTPPFTNQKQVVLPGLAGLICIGDLRTHAGQRVCMWPTLPYPKYIKHSDQYIYIYIYMYVKTKNAPSHPPPHPPAAKKRKPRKEVALRNAARPEVKRPLRQVHEAFAEGQRGEFAKARGPGAVPRAKHSSGCVPVACSPSDLKLFWGKKHFFSFPLGGLDGPGVRGVSFFFFFFSGFYIGQGTRSNLNPSHEI